MSADSPAVTSASSPVVGPRLSMDVRNLVLSAEAGAPHQHCLVCYSDLEYKTILPCHHNEICPVCLLRLRFLHHDSKCPICKAEHEQVIVDTHTTNKVFGDYPIWGNELGNNFVYRGNVGMFFPVEYFHREIQPLFGFPCNFRNCNFDGALTMGGTETASDDKNQKKDNKQSKLSSSKKALRALQDHLRTKHRLALCNLCAEYPRDFVARLQRFTQSQLKDHMTKGDGAASGFSGHPLCEFCRPKRFYDLTELHKHLTKEHYKCHVCEKMGLDNQFFRDYDALEKHFDRQHFLCKDAQCLAARFVVFANEIDFADHQRHVHNMAASDTKIQLQFRVRSTTAAAPEHQQVPDEDDFNYGLDGEAFVPAALPESQGELALHPRHVERTAELRQLAAAMRDNLELAAEAFPTLQAMQEEVLADASASAQLRMGWTDGTSIRRVARAKPAGTVTEDDFPTLPTAPKRSTAQAKVQVKGNRAFAMNSVSNGGWSGAAAAVPVSSSATTSFLAPASRTASVSNASNLSADNFPSLAPSNSQSRPNYAAANSLANRMATKPLNFNGESFPSLSSGQNVTYGSSLARPKAHQSMKKAPPSISSDADFPAPPTSSHSYPKLRGHDTYETPSASAKATVDSIKASLGSAKYKILKGYTKEFAAGELEAEAFVDHAASLFDKGYADEHFWSFIPALVSSCPDHYASAKAIRYMDHLKVMRNAALNAETARASTMAATPASVPQPTHPPPMASAIAARYTPMARPPPPIGRYVSPPEQTTQQLHSLRQGKPSKSAWDSTNGTGLNNKVPAQAPSRSAAGSQPKPASAPTNNGSKKEMQTGNGSGRNKNKKQNEELRKLAFG